MIVDHDDAASRETRELLERLAADEPRLRVERTPSHSRGLWSVQRARDYGAEIASSELIIALDDDVVAREFMVTGHARLAEIFALQAIKRPRTKCWGHDDQELGLPFLRDGLRGVYDPKLKGEHWYKRTLRGFIPRAGAPAVSQNRLRAKNADLLKAQAPEPKSRLRRLRFPLAAASHPKPGWFLVRWSLMAAISVAAILRLTSVEDAAARHLWHVAQERSLAADESGPAGD